jgi:hypothetical protein
MLTYRRSARSADKQLIAMLSTLSHVFLRGPSVYLPLVSVLQLRLNAQQLDERLPVP